MVDKWHAMRYNKGTKLNKGQRPKEVKKMEKLNKKQQLADEVFKQVATGYIYDLECESKEDLLKNHEELVNKIYNLVVCDPWLGWLNYCNDTMEIKKYVKHQRYIHDYVRLCGKEFLMQCVEKYVKNMGY